MFYLAELLNRLIIENKLDFSYQDVLNKMMMKYPDDRFKSFGEIKVNISKKGFSILDISDEDKEIYQKFTNGIRNTIIEFQSNKIKYINDVDVFISKIEKVIATNIFEEYVQNNDDLINCIVEGEYYSLNHHDEYQEYSCPEIYCTDIKAFLKWFKESSPELQELILTNIIAKLSLTRVVIRNEDLPF